MKYIEELSAGQCFEFQKNYFLLTQDFKKNGQRLCIRLDSGIGNWLKPDCIVNTTDLFTMDKDSNIIAIKERKKTDVSDQTQDIH